MLYPEKYKCMYLCTILVKKKKITIQLLSCVLCDKMENEKFFLSFFFILNFFLHK